MSTRKSSSYTLFVILSVVIAALSFAGYINDLIYI